MNFDDLEERIRQRAYAIWEQEGCPEGRQEEHWQRAREELAILDNVGQTLLPNPSQGGDDTARRTEPVEPILSAEAQGEGFGPAGQGDIQPVPAKRTRTVRRAR